MRSGRPRLPVPGRVNPLHPNRDRPLVPAPRNPRAARSRHSPVKPRRGHPLRVPGPVSPVPVRDGLRRQANLVPPRDGLQHPVSPVPPRDGLRHQANPVQANRPYQPGQEQLPPAHPRRASQLPERASRNRLPLVRA
jgi:hypothetical protein